MGSQLALIVASIHIGLLVIFFSNLLYLRRRPRPQPEKPHPFVSIIIPARNEEDNLQRLLPSILSQNYETFEVIVYDDDSTDGTWNVLSSYKDARVHIFKGNGPPDGWVGKVHALYQATKHASGTHYLFLDADTELADADALSRLVAQYQQLPANSVMTSLPRYKGNGLLVVSLLPNAIMAGIPWYLVRPFPASSLGALNGQCWMIDADKYKTHEPHKAVANEILEDVLIGRYLKKLGITPTLVDLRRELSVYMYSSFPDAWRGFRKNAFLLSGGHVLSFLFIVFFFSIVYIFPPVIALWLLPFVFLNKWVTDRHSMFPFWLTLCAPLSFILGLTLQLDSAWHHLSGRVSWKGRSIR
ncbi:MAG: glycosyltransferase family 2 protein [Rhodothermaceae bacterium]|nr:glycosyltransferase family 2 protein [Rhodothermaceae bacterium]